MPKSDPSSSAPKYPPGEAKKQIKRLRRKGKGARAIALELGLSTQIVHRHLRELNGDGGAA